VTCAFFSTDGSLLATCGWDSNAYAPVVSAILREAGLKELLSNPNVRLAFLVDLQALNTLSQDGDKLFLDIRDTLIDPSHWICTHTF
jgi:hypothetical protein